MSLFLRIVVIFFAAILATWAAGITIALALLGPEWHGFTGDFAERTGFWMLVVFATSFTGGMVILPLLVFVVAAETLRWRSLLIYAAAGAVMLIGGYFGTGMHSRYDESVGRSPPVARETEIAAAAGVVFGLVYWAIAGRKAGAWRAREGRTAA
ncbi:MAG: hypothetical protein WD073_04985 [Xanthobacteraceae bacterium]